MRDLQDQALSALVRAASWRLIQAAPLWLAVLIVIAALFFGGHHLLR